MTSPWIVKQKAVESPRFTLIAVPFAGGSASAFKSWARGLPDDIDLLAVQMPGRASRNRELLLENVEEIVEGLHTEVSQYLDRPYVLLGYSLGSLIAYELAHRIQAHDQRQPERLVVLASNAPHVSVPVADLYSLSDSDFIEHMQTQFGGIPSVVLENPELRAMLVPILRADMMILKNYQFDTNRPRLKIPLSAFSGDGDPRVTANGLERWREVTDAPSQIEQFKGPHFFVDANPEKFFDSLGSLLCETT